MTTVLIFEYDGIADQILGRLKQWGYELTRGKSENLDVYVVGDKEVTETAQPLNDRPN